jgi:hypothetical protein
MSDQLPQCSYTDLRRCMGYPVDPAAPVPLCLTHLTRVLEYLRDRGVRMEVAKSA